jgi:hypothetical protein
MMILNKKEILSAIVAQMTEQQMAIFVELSKEFIGMKPDNSKLLLSIANKFKELPAKNNWSGIWFVGPAEDGKTEYRTSKFVEDHLVNVEYKI